MFDYVFAEQGMPWVQCPTCNHKMKFHGGWYPSQVICQNCGQHVDLTQALSKLTYPNHRFDKDGYIVKEETEGSFNGL